MHLNTLQPKTRLQQFFITGHLEKKKKEYETKESSDMLVVARVVKFACIICTPLLKLQSVELPGPL